MAALVWLPLLLRATALMGLMPSCRGMEAWKPLPFLMAAMPLMLTLASGSWLCALTMMGLMLVKLRSVGWVMLMPVSTAPLMLIWMGGENSGVSLPAMLAAMR